MKNFSIEKEFETLINKGWLTDSDAKLYQTDNDIIAAINNSTSPKKEDIFNATEFKNPVAYSNYPIDIHSIKKDNSILNYVQKVYSVPLESLICLFLTGPLAPSFSPGVNSSGVVKVLPPSRETHEYVRQSEIGLPYLK